MTTAKTTATTEKRSHRGTTLLAVRAKCLDCSTTFRMVKYCTIVDCPLWPYRFGKRPRTVKARHPELLDPQHVLSVVLPVD